MQSAEGWIELGNRVFFPVYPRLPIVIDRAQGCMLYDVEGKSYLDFLSGIGVNALGYAHPRLMEALKEQMDRFLHLSNFFYQPPQILLAQRLLQRTGMQKLFFTNSGSEAIEAALKLARRWGAQNGKSEILGFIGGFHGRTYGPLSIMHQARFREQMGPFLPDTLVAPFNDPATLPQFITEQTAAVVLEIIQGAGGIVEATSDFLQTLADLHRQLGFLLIVDEIQTGFGRTGSWFAVDHTPLRPDMLTLGKAIGGGLPLGALLGGPRVADLWDLGHHGSTYGGNALACAAGLVVLEELENGLLEHVQQMATILEEHLQQLQQQFPHLIRELRGRGLMRGIVLSQPAAPFAQAAVYEGLIINATAHTVLRLLPPLIISEEELTTGIRILARLFERIQTSSGDDEAEAAA